MLKLAGGWWNFHERIQQDSGMHDRLRQREIVLH
jgi:hypothetical protein